MPEITYQMLDLEIQHLATLRSEIEPILPQLKTEKNQAAANLKKREDELSAAEDAVRVMALEYVQQTGDLTPHPSLTFRRTTKLMYDKDDLVDAFIVQGLSEILDAELKEKLLAGNVLRKPKLGKYLNISVTLDVRAFEKDFKDGILKWAQVEEIPSPTIAINKLGDILIKKELEEKPDVS